MLLASIKQVLQNCANLAQLPLEKWSFPSTQLHTDLMFSHDSMGVVPPPTIHTVKNTMSRVVENIIWCEQVAVSRIARANAMAPLRPIKKNEVTQLQKCSPDGGQHSIFPCSLPATKCQAESTGLQQVSNSLDTLINHALG